MEIKKGLKRWAPSAALAATLLASTSAFAGTVTIDGITIPIGISLPGGFGSVANITTESLITGAGQTLVGDGVISQFYPAASPGTPTWVSGQNGMTMAVVFGGFVSNVVTPSSITFTGGTISLYVFNGALPPLDGLGSITADLASASSGKLWLSANAVPTNAAGDTLTVNILLGTLTNFQFALGTALLDVTGGDAAGNLKTCTFPNAFDPSGKGCSDMTLTQDSNISSLSSDFNDPILGVHVSSTGHANFNSIPSPASLGLMGIGLLGFGLLKRRQSKA